MTEGAQTKLTLTWKAFRKQLCPRSLQSRSTERHLRAGVQKQEVKAGPLELRMLLSAGRLTAQPPLSGLLARTQRFSIRWRGQMCRAASLIDPGCLCVQYQPQTFSLSTRSRLKACMKTFCINGKKKNYALSAKAEFNTENMFTILKILCIRSWRQEMWGHAVMD